MDPYIGAIHNKNNYKDYSSEEEYKGCYSEYEDIEESNNGVTNGFDSEDAGGVGVFSDSETKKIVRSNSAPDLRVPEENRLGKSEEKTDEVANQALDEQETSWMSLGMQILFPVVCLTCVIGIAAIVTAVTIPYFLSIAATGGVSAIALPIFAGMAAVALATPFLLPFFVQPPPPPEDVEEK